jgi:class 3 adenylate cyclase
MPLNIAARLQGAIKDNDKADGRVLMSASAYQQLRYAVPRDNYRIVKVKRDLRNVGPMPEPIKLYLYEGPRSEESKTDGPLLSVSRGAGSENAR